MRSASETLQPRDAGPLVCWKNIPINAGKTLPATTSRQRQGPVVSRLCHTVQQSRTQKSKDASRSIPSTSGFPLYGLAPPKCQVRPNGAQTVRKGAPSFRFTFGIFRLVAAFNPEPLPTKLLWQQTDDEQHQASASASKTTF